MKNLILIFISFLIFVSGPVIAASKTNPDISVNVLFLGKKSFSKDKHEEEETYKDLLKNRARHFARSLKGNKGNKEKAETPSASEDSHLHEINEGFSLQEVEIYFKSNIDPYWAGNVSLGIVPHGNHVDIDLEEAYVESLFIPDWTFRAGKFYAFLGRHNNLHTHYYPFIDPPLINQTLFGFHGWSGSGASLAYLSPLPWYSEIIAQTFYSHDEKKKLSGALFFKNLWDLSDSSTLEIDLTYGTGVKKFKHLYNAALVWKWKPLKSSKQHSLAWTTELLQAVGDSSKDNAGVNSYIQWRFLNNWSMEGRAEYLFHPEWEDFKTQKYSFLLAFAATEYSALRVQYDIMKSEDHKKWGHSVAIQGNVSMGTHPAHLY